MKNEQNIEVIIEILSLNIDLNNQFLMVKFNGVFFKNFPNSLKTNICVWAI